MSGACDRGPLARSVHGRDSLPAIPRARMPWGWAWLLLGASGNLSREDTVAARAGSVLSFGSVAIAGGVAFGSRGRAAGRGVRALRAGARAGPAAGLSRRAP